MYRTQIRSWAFLQERVAVYAVPEWYWFNIHDFPILKFLRERKPRHAEQRVAAGIFLSGFR